MIYCGMTFEEKFEYANNIALLTYGEIHMKFLYTLSQLYQTKDKKIMNNSNYELSNKIFHELEI